MTVDQLPIRVGWFSVCELLNSDTLETAIGIYFGVEGTADEEIPWALTFDEAEGLGRLLLAVAAQWREGGKEWRS